MKLPTSLFFLQPPMPFLSPFQIYGLYFFVIVIYVHMHIHTNTHTYKYLNTTYFYLFDFRTDQLVSYTYGGGSSFFFLFISSS